MSRQINANNSQGLKPRIFKEHGIYKQIEDAGNRHKNRLSFILSAREMLQLLSDQPYSSQIEELLLRKLDQAEGKVDKRPIQKQREVRNKYQPTHGLVFKNIPYHVPRQVVYDAIVKMGQLKRDQDGSPAFPGGLKMRSFMYPDNRKAATKMRNGFPIFVRQADRNTLLKWAQMQDWRIQLVPEDSEEHRFKAASWDGVVLVEPVRGENGEFHQQRQRPEINLVDEIEPPMTMEPERYGAKTPPLNPPMQPSFQHLQGINVQPQFSQNNTTVFQNFANTLQQNTAYNQLPFQPFDISQLSIAGSPPLPPHLMHSGASTPLSASSEMLFDASSQNMYPSSQASPVGPYVSQQISLPAEIQGQQLNQQFGVSRVAGGDSNPVIQQAIDKVVTARVSSPKKQAECPKNVNDEDEARNSTPTSEVLASDEMD